MTQLPFVTDRTQLAMLLEMAGQKRVAMQNRYSAAQLDKIGCRTIKEALAQGKPGKVFYLFAQTPELPEMVAAYFDQEKRCKARQSSEAPDALTGADLVRIGVSVLSLRSEYVHLWKAAGVQLCEGGEPTSEVTDTVTVTPLMIEKGHNVSPFDGKTYSLGEQMPIEGQVHYLATKSVGIKVSPQLRAEVSL